MGDPFQYIKLPDGSMGKFRSDLPDDQIKQAIAKDFPNAYGKAPAATPPEAEVRAWHPSFWEGLKSSVPVVGQVADVLSGRKSPMSSMRPEDTTQLAYPERALGAEGQAKHPIVTGFDEFAGSITSPDNLMLMQGLGALGAAPKAIGRVLPRIASGIFTGQMGKAAYDLGTQAKSMHSMYQQTGDERYKNEAERLWTHAILNGGFGLLSLGHASGLGDKTGMMAEPNPEAVNPSPKTGSAPETIKAKIPPPAEAKPASVPETPTLKAQGLEFQDSIDGKVVGKASVKEAAKAPLETPEAPSRARANLTSPPESGIMVGKGEDNLFTHKDLTAVADTKLEVPKLGTSKSKPTLVDKTFIGDVDEAPARNDFMRLIFRRGQELKAQGLSEPEQAFSLMKEFPHYADQIAAGFRSKSSANPSMGGENSPTSQPIQPKESVQAASASAQSGESVQATQRPALVQSPHHDLDLKAQAMAKAEKDAGKLPEGVSYVQRSQQLKDQLIAESKSDPRSMRGSVTPPRLPDINVFNKRVQERLKRSPGMAEGTAKRIIAEEMRKESGTFSLRPLKKDAPFPNPQTAIQDLTNKVTDAVKAESPDKGMKIAERVANEWNETKDAVVGSLGKLAGHAVALKDWYMRETPMTDFRSAVGRFSGSLNRSAWELRQFAKSIKDQFPDAGRREAVTNYIQAGGDDAVLADRANRSKGKLRAGYEAARTLTPEEKQYADLIKSHFDTRLKEAINTGVLKDGLENYVPQVWKPKDQTNMGHFFSSLHRSGLLKPDFNSAKKRFFDSYFEGEQAGRVPVNKDIGFLVSSWDKALNQALASRAFIKDLTAGLAKDGRPIIAPSGSGRAYHPLTTEPAEAFFIHPKAGPEDTGDYKALNHSALTKWTWAAKDDNGAPIFVKGDLRVHPDHAAKLDNVINRGRWAAEHPIQTSILKGQSFFKQTLLAGLPVNPFHQIQEGTHALFHKVNPFNPPSIDINHPTMTKLLDNGLVIGNFDPIAAFEEGVSTGGLIGKIPGFGRFQQKYTEYLFQDYIPRLKAKMAMDAHERNMERFDKAIKNGDITTDQVAELTSNQANAAFGELNYMMMGRHPQTQALMRMAFLAPDFLEARARFAGQALRPYGREQYAALIRGAVGLYVMARIGNQLLDNDPHWDKPFSVVANGYEYTIRSLPGDIYHMLSDHNSFVMHRLNPTLVKPLMEEATGKDDFGRKRTMGEQAIDFVRGFAPMQAQGAFKSGDRDLVGSVMQSFGISRKTYRSDAASLAHQYALEGMPSDITSHHVTEMVKDIEKGEFNSKKAMELIQEGKMNPRDLMEAIKLSHMPEIYRDFHRLPTEQKAKVFAAATQQERALLTAYSKRALDTSRLLPEQRQQFSDQLSH